MSAGVVGREIRTAVERCYTELFPAMICVVDSDVADQILDSGPSFDMRFLLEAYPRLSHEEARSADKLLTLIRQRRRQGLLRDWLAVLSPRRTLRRIISRYSDEAMR